MFLLRLKAHIRLKLQLSFPKRCLGFYTSDLSRHLPSRTHHSDPFPRRTHSFPLEPLRYVTSGHVSQQNGDGRNSSHGPE